jgi:hypothetical protein
MEVDQGPNWGCSAKEKKNVISCEYLCYFINFLMSVLHSCGRFGTLVQIIELQVNSSLCFLVCRNRSNTKEEK